MTAGTVRLEFDGAIATATLDRPAKLNALTTQMLDGLESALAAVTASDARVLLLRGAGDRAFCVGADIDRFAGLGPVGMWRDWIAHGHRAFDALARLRQPTVAVIRGVSFGGGLELALACDFRIVADDARLGLPEVGLGTVPGWGGTQRLTELVGPARAKEMVLARRVLDGQTALRWGLATDSAASGELPTAVDALVERLRAGAPVAVQVAKQLIDASAAGAQGRVLESLAGGLTAATHDLSEGVAAFRGRREPTFQGR